MPPVLQTLSAILQNRNCLRWQREEVRLVTGWREGERRQWGKIQWRQLWISKRRRWAWLTREWKEEDKQGLPAFLQLAVACYSDVLQKGKRAISHLGQRGGYFSDLKSTLLLFQLMLFVVLFPIKYFNAHQTFGSSSSACLAYLLLVRQQTAVPSFVCLPYRPFGSLLLEESYSSFVAEVGPCWPSGLDLLVVDLLAYSSVDRLCLPLSWPSGRTSYIAPEFLPLHVRWCQIHVLLVQSVISVFRMVCHRYPILLS